MEFIKVNLKPKAKVKWKANGSMLEGLLLKILLKFFWLEQMSLEQNHSPSKSLSKIKKIDKFSSSKNSFKPAKKKTSFFFWINQNLKILSNSMSKSYPSSKKA